MSYLQTILALMALASVSPILTLLHLWQMKEWRWDRLMDHLKTEGILVSLTSKIRLAIGAVWMSAGVALFLTTPVREYSVLYLSWVLTLGIMLCIASAFQWARKMQPMPVWTRKAELMLLVSLLSMVTLGLSSITTYNNDVSRSLGSFIVLLSVFALPYIAPLFVLSAWIILLPIDLYLKKRIIARAIKLREAHPHLRVIGITGSVGKTTTKELLKHLLEPLGALATPLHVNTELGVARWLSSVLENEPADSKKIIIVEMGAYRTGEIALLAKIAKPTIGVLCFVGRQHSSLFGGEVAIAHAKSELLDALPKDGEAFINADSPLIEIMKQHVVSGATYVGTDARADTRALDIEETGQGISFQYDKTLLTVPMAGTHNVTNILLALCTAKKFGMSMQEIARRLSSFTAFERTFVKRQEHGVTILDNTYNASVEGFLAAIEWAGKQSESEKVLLFDGIIELGTDEEKLHRMIANKAANVFTKAFGMNKRFLPYFQPFFGERVTMVPKKPEALSTGTLLVCIGRMSPKIVERFVTHQCDAGQ